MANNYPLNHPRHKLLLRALIVLLLAAQALAPASLQAAPAIAAPSAATPSGFIVQAADAGMAARAVKSVGGQVMRDLSVIQAVSASLSAEQQAALSQMPGVKRVWADAVVQANDSADPGVIYTPVSGGEAKQGNLDPVKVSTCDSARDNFDTIPVGALDENNYQSYTLTPPVNPASLPAMLKLRFVFKEKSLNQAQLRVFQASTNTWFPFNINTLATNDAIISTTIDVSFLRANPQDISPLQVRFYVSRNEGGEKAEVDCANLGFYNSSNRLLANYKPSASWETTTSSFDLNRLAAPDDSRENLDPIPLNDLSTSGYQNYTFSPVVDPANLPGLVDLRFVFKEKSLNRAQVRVYQNSTRKWFSFDLNTLGTDDQIIDTILDLAMCW